ncbi:MAG: tripartite tricarboxylate transporter substrate binding protein [Proteobacteria bacterium]|nr:tripartite tricarboxylate transporter substrate binding protein [Pseudomonadota bacterium]MBU2226763.1 tripartite tricarboxylate transporter substrate binding protein [Pseudomonadota bacterium]
MKLRNNRPNMKPLYLPFHFTSLLIGAAILLFVGGWAQAAEVWPNKEIRLIVPSSPGGTVDTAARLIQPFWEKTLGVPLVVENRPGGNLALGFTLIAKADPDGSAIGVYAAPHLEFTILTQKVEYTMDSFDFIGSFGFDPGVIRVHRDAPYNDFKGFIDWVKRQPKGSVSVGVSAGTSSNVLGLREIEKLAGVEFNIVPFKGGTEARLAVVGKHAVATHTQIFVSRSIARDTKVIAVHYGKNNWKDLTDNAKTIKEEMGWNVMDTGSGSGFMVTAKLRKEHPDRFDKLVKTYKAAMESKDFLERMRASETDRQLDYIAPEQLKADMGRSVIELGKYKAFIEK